MPIRILRANLGGGRCAVTGQECDELFVIQDDAAGSDAVQVSVRALAEVVRRRARTPDPLKGLGEEGEGGRANGRSANATIAGG